jgi:hypothetical protein
VHVTINVVDTQANLARSISAQLAADLRNRMLLGSA